MNNIYCMLKVQMIELYIKATSLSFPLEVCMIFNYLCYGQVHFQMYEASIISACAIQDESNKLLRRLHFFSNLRKLSFVSSGEIFCQLHATSVDCGQSYDCLVISFIQRAQGKVTVSFMVCQTYQKIDSRGKQFQILIL